MCVALLPLLCSVCSIATTLLLCVYCCYHYTVVCVVLFTSRHQRWFLLTTSGYTQLVSCSFVDHAARVPLPERAQDYDVYLPYKTHLTLPLGTDSCNIYILYMCDLNHSQQVIRYFTGRGETISCSRALPLPFLIPLPTPPL